MMDRDFPMTPRDRRVLAISLAVGAVIGILLFGGWIPGLHPHYGSMEYMTVGGRSYYWTAVTVPLPNFGENYSDPYLAVVHNVTFWYWITNWSALATSELHGNATLTNGTSYDFVLGGGPPLVPRTTQYVSPDDEVAVLWSGGIQADLLVLAHPGPG